MGLIFSSPSVFYVEGLSSPAQGKSSVWGAFFLYLTTFIISVISGGLRKSEEGAVEEVEMMHGVREYRGML